MTTNPSQGSLAFFSGASQMTLPGQQVCRCLPLLLQSLCYRRVRQFALQYVYPGCDVMVGVDQISQFCVCQFLDIGQSGIGQRHR